MDNWLTAYADVLQALNKENLHTLDAIASSELEFKDPFNHTYSLDSFKAILNDMYVKLGAVDFVVEHFIESGLKGTLVWRFSGESSLLGQVDFAGMSYVEADEKGMVRLHHDHWDSADLLSKIPVAGGLVRFLHRRCSHQS